MSNNGNNGAGTIGCLIVLLAGALIYNWPIWAGAAALAVIGWAIYARSTKPDDQAWIALATFGVILLALAGWSYKAQLDQHAAEEAEKVAAQIREQAKKAEEAKEKAEEAKEKAIEEERERARISAAAKKWGVSPADYRKAVDSQSMAHTVCREYVKKEARWTARDTDSYNDYEWIPLRGGKVRITAKDVIFTNGFGGEQNTYYSCVYDHATGEYEIEQIG